MDERTGVFYHITENNLGLIDDYNYVLIKVSDGVILMASAEDDIKRLIEKAAAITHFDRLIKIPADQVTLKFGADNE